MKKIARKQLTILRHLSIIESKTDEQAQTIFSILMNCKNEWEMERKLRDLKTGDKTVKQFITQYKN